MKRAFAIAALAALPALGMRAQETDSARVLARAGAYLAQYEHDVTAVVAQEEYLQRVPIEPRSRRLKSELVIVAEATGGWVEFRDIFEVDGRAVRDRDQRIVRLFLKPNADALTQARHIVEESARFNLSPSRAPFTRTLNVPLTALRFLRLQNQARSSWESSRGQPIDGTTVTILRFTEVARPRMIGTREGTAATGQFWIDDETGAVLRSQLVMKAARVDANIEVQYSAHPVLKLWLPASMDEVYRIRADIAVLVDGRATYSNFRQFRVDTSMIVK